MINQHFSNKKEERQWKRQRVASKEERDERAKSEEIEHLRELYHKCVLTLSIYMTKVENKNDDEGGNFVTEINDIHHWLSLLLLRHPHNKLSRLIDGFLYSPDWHDAEQLRKYVLSLVEHEELLDYPGRIKESTSTSDEQKSKGRTITFRISEQFRRDQLVLGVELPQSYYYSYELQSLTDEQRERLLKVFFQSHKKIPENAQLYLPMYNPNAKKINYQDKQWEATINPNSNTILKVLELWGQDFDKSLSLAEKSLNAMHNKAN